MSCHFSLSCYCRAIHSLISYHPPRISVAMNWSSGAVNGSQRTQRRCELWNGSSIRGCRPHFIPPMGTMVTNWVELLFIVLIIKHSWPSFSSRGGVLTPSITPPSTPLIMECALVSTRQHCNWATSQSLRTTVVIMVFFAAFILQPLYRAAEFRQKIIIKESLPLSFLDYESRYYSLYCNCVPQDLLFQSSRHRKTAAWSLSIFYKIATHENETGVRQSRFFCSTFPLKNYVYWLVYFSLQTCEARHDWWWWMVIDTIFVHKQNTSSLCIRADVMTEMEWGSIFVTTH